MLVDNGIEFIEKTDDEGGKRFDKVQPGDVVILPAFGATLAEMQHFDALGVTTVDTTCPWVTKVWNVVDKQVARRRQLETQERLRIFYVWCSRVRRRRVYDVRVTIESVRGEATV